MDTTESSGGDAAEETAVSEKPAETTTQQDNTPKPQAPKAEKTYSASYVGELRQEAAKNRKAYEKTSAEYAELSEQVEALTAERDQAVDKALRLSVAQDKGVPNDLVDRLKGSTKEELESDAEALLSALSSQRGRQDVGQSAKSPATTKPADPLLDAVVERL